MKKIITLLFSVGAFAASFAQSGSHQNNNNKNKRSGQYAINTPNANYRQFDNHRDNIYFFSAKEKQQQINKINNDYNFTIKSIKSNRHISHREKKQMIKKAQLEKAQQIQIVNSKFNNKYNSAFNNYHR